MTLFYVSCSIKAIGASCACYMLLYYSLLVFCVTKLCVTNTTLCITWLHVLWLILGCFVGYSSTWLVGQVGMLVNKKLEVICNMTTIA